jgi:hypothetical protein
MSRKIGWPIRKGRRGKKKYTGKKRGRRKKVPFLLPADIVARLEASPAGEEPLIEGWDTIAACLGLSRAGVLNYYRELIDLGVVFRITFLYPNKQTVAFAFPSLLREWWIKTKLSHWYPEK